MIMHCGGKIATWEETTSVEPPAATDSYQPVPHAELVRLLRQRMKKEVGLVAAEEKYGLAREGRRFFYEAKYKWKDSELMKAAVEERGIDPEVFQKYDFQIVARNSYDRSLAVGVAGGTSCCICDNTALHGNWFRMIRKHSGKVMEDMKSMISNAAEHAMDAYLETALYQEALRDVECDRVRGYEVLGRARGEGVLTPQQAERAFSEWNDLLGKETHAFHTEQNAHGLYQCFTEALKLGGSARKLRAYTGVPDLFAAVGFAPGA